jgi:S-formylglutathione hydrolase FrmB
VLDFTHNHGADRRIYSPALDEKRDLYVYLPPGFDPNRLYPAMVMLHGITQDEQFLLRIVEKFDAAMACGRLPPFIVVAPDGSIPGRPTFVSPGSFFLNSKAGRFEDYVVQDVWGFLVNNFPIRPEREFHMLAGASMGGFGAYNLGIKHRDCFKILVGIMPALNLRYEDCHGRYFAHFDPDCTGLRENLRPWQPVGRYFGVFTIRERTLAYPLFGKWNKNAINRIAAENPIEMLEAYDVQPGQFDLFVGYGGRDEFNIDAQVESFLYVARQRGIQVAVAYDPNGHHTVATGLRLFPDFVRWLGPVLYSYEQSLPPPPAGPETRDEGEKPLAGGRAAR